MTRQFQEDVYKRQGYENIVCTQPFGCLPNHINGKGAIRKIKEIRPNANIVTIDYDPGAQKVNQENRIKLMLCLLYTSNIIRHGRMCQSVCAKAVLKEKFTMTILDSVKGTVNLSLIHI